MYCITKANSLSTTPLSLPYTVIYIYISIYIMLYSAVKSTVVFNFIFIYLQAVAETWPILEGGASVEGTYPIRGLEYVPDKKLKFEP